MRVDEYKNLFDSYLDNKIFNQFVMLSPTRITHEEKLNILDEIAFRLQVEFQKQVILLTNRDVDGDIFVIDKNTKVSEIPLIINNMKSAKQELYGNVVCLIDIDFPYFEESNSWENRLVETMKYYKIPVFGFSNNTQMIYIYEN
jgi:hypothetical protein